MIFKDKQRIPSQKQGLLALLCDGILAFPGGFYSFGKYP